MPKSSNQFSLYLSRRTQDALRPGEPNVSRRINQIVERYLEMADSDTVDVLEEFDESELAAIAELWNGISVYPPAMAAHQTLCRLIKDTDLASKVRGLTAGDFFLLIERLESDALAAEEFTSSTHSG